MKLEQSNKLQSAFVLEQCSKKIHDDCRNIRDALIEDSDGCIQEAFTTNAIVGDVTWCVAASALVPTNKAAQFEKQLRNAKTKDKTPITVKHLKIILDKQ